MAFDVDRLRPGRFSRHALGVGLVLALSLGRSGPAVAELDDTTFNFVREGLEFEIDASVRAIFLEIEGDAVADSLVKAPVLLGDLIRVLQGSVLEAIDAHADPNRTTPALSTSRAKRRSREATFARFPERREHKRPDTDHFANIAARVRKVTGHVLSWGYDPDTMADDVIVVEPGTMKTTYGAAYRRCLTAFLWTLDYWSRSKLEDWAPSADYHGYLNKYDHLTTALHAEVTIVDEDCRWYYCFGKCVPYCPTDDPPDNLDR